MVDKSFVDSVDVGLSNGLTARWVRRLGPESSVVSGAAVWPLLAFLATATDRDGEERRELEAALGAPAATAAAAAARLVRGLDRIPGVGAGVAIWFDPEVVLRPQWLAGVPTDSVGVLTDDSAVDRWVRERTGGLIDRLSVGVHKDALVVLAMALAVRTRWRQPFTASGLWPAGGPWAGRVLPSLYRADPHLDHVAVFTTPIGELTVLDVVGGPELTVHLVIGPAGESAGPVLAEAITAIDGDHPRRVGAEITTVAPGINFDHPAIEPGPTLFTYIPAFRITAGHDLIEQRELFGLGAVTDISRGRLPGLSEQPLAIGQARQDLVACFSAEGFEAAAVTQIDAVAGGMPPPAQPHNLCLSFDRPFGFLARSPASGLILLAGWVGDNHDRDDHGNGWAGDPA